MTDEDIRELRRIKRALSDALEWIDRTLDDQPPWAGPADWRKPPGFVGGAVDLRWIHPDGSPRIPKHGGWRRRKPRDKQGQSRPRRKGKRAA